MKLLKPYFLLLYVACVLLVSACGQTGDLYLPEVGNESEEAKSKQEKPDS